MEEALKKNRAILHIDLDAFYCQVEHVRLGIPQNVPLCVQQWQGLIAVNYPARAAGIKRHDNVKEALEKCPSLTLVHVATYAPNDTTPQYHTENISPKTHKVSLDYYRKESAKIMNVFMRFVKKERFQRASIDEAYLDVTDVVNDEIRKEVAESKIVADANGGDENGGDGPRVEWDGLGILVGDQITESFGWSDLQLCYAARLSHHIRQTLHATLGYTSTTGISPSKTLSKLCSSLNKPNNQTILRQSQISSFMSSLPVTKIRNLGGKLGSEVLEKLGVELCGQVWPFSLGEIKSKFGDATGVWLYNIVRGICHDPVTETSLPKSLSSHKALRPPIKQSSQLHHWIGILASELYTRVMDELELRNRYPKTISVQYTIKGETRSKSGGMVARHGCSIEGIENKVWSLIKGEVEMGKLWPCSGIAAGVSGFENVEKGRGLEGWFGKAVEKSEAREGSETSKRQSTGETIEWHSTSGIPGQETIQEPMTTQPSPIAKPSGTLLSYFSPPSSSSASTTPVSLPTSTTPKPQNILTYFSPQTKTEPSDADTEFDTTTCPKCHRSIPVSPRSVAEHQDWHFAVEVERGERGDGSSGKRGREDEVVKGRGKKPIKKGKGKEKEKKEIPNGGLVGFFERGKG